MLIEILQLWGVHLPEKCPFSVKAKNFLIGYLHFEEKMSVVKWEESIKLCLAFHGTRKINKKFTFAYPIISRKNVRCKMEDKSCSYKIYISGVTIYAKNVR